MPNAGWRPRPDQVARYTEGDCWLLAFQLGQILAAPITTLCTADDPADWQHVAVDLGRERLLDVTGTRPREELRADWETRTGTRLVFRELGFFHVMEEYLDALDGSHLGWFISRHDEDSARTVAHRIARAITGGHNNHDHSHTSGSDQPAVHHVLRGSGRFREERVGA